MRQRKHARNGVAAALFAVATMAGAEDESLIEHMHSHYDAVVKIQHAVIAGSLEGTRTPAAWLVEHPAPAGMPADWQGYVDTMRAAARDALEAEDLTAAAHATSRLGLACGGCHTANNIIVEFDEVDMPPDQEGSKAHMQRHQWAADRMWEGLIGPADWSWSRGGNMLFESPLRHKALGAESDDDPSILMARRVHQLAANATAVSTPEDKAEIYAEFLANCANCHTSLGQGPRR